MHIDQQNLRDLHDQLLTCRGHDVEPTVDRWRTSSLFERQWLLEFRSRGGWPIPPATVEDLWRLYAFSRVNEVLLLNFQPTSELVKDYASIPISLDQYVEFMIWLGFQVHEQMAFHPFYHEIVTVEQAEDPDTPITLKETLWPCLMLGPMLFSRAGCRVSGGRNHIVKEIAETSTLYWAYRRRNRPHEDLSHGWGSNSQWRTSFRRDYRVGNAAHLNVDEKTGVDQPLEAQSMGRRDELLVPERVELLMHRCFIKTRKPHHDRWPYNDTLTTPV